MAKPDSSLFVISRLQAEMDRLFREVLQLDEASLEAGEWQPNLDIVERPGSIVILVEVPGVRARDLKLEVEGNKITLYGVKTASTSGASEVRFQCMERSSGKFSREVQLFSAVNSHRGKAHLRDGLLTVEFPKIQDQRQRPLNVRIEDDKEAADG